MSEIALWPHQQRVFDLLRTGKNVILQAPTGSGKTRAALYPFLYALDYQTAFHSAFPQKCIYSVPMRVLARQFYAEYMEIVSQYALKYGLDITTAMQTGDRAEDPLLASNLIFATIDQTLSSFLQAPYSLSRARANLNAGAVMASYLVFDEFHLYDPISTLPTTLHMLDMLKGITPFILMTATFSADMLDELADLLDAIMIPGTTEEQHELLKLESQQKTRRYHVQETLLTAQSVLDRHEGRTLVICNTVDRARQLYETLHRHTQAGTEVLLLHSRFLPTNRDQTEEYIRACFAQGQSEGDIIVVSTQAIEVGVDITSMALHTELAPANAILQRAGRCARYPGDEGDVFIYPYVPDAETGERLDLTEQVLPYQGMEPEFVRTFEALRDYSGMSLAFTDEQAIITAVHGERDRQILAKLRIATYDHRRRMFSVMRGEDTQDAKNLIRDVFQQQVTIHSHPADLLEAPFAVPSFGLHPGTLQGYAQDWLARFEQNDDIPWAIKWLSQVPDPEQSNRTEYKWDDAFDSPRQIFGAPLVVVHPALATYHPQLGFLPDRGGDWQATLPENTGQVERRSYTYRLETYEEHIRQVYRAAFESRGMWDEMAPIAHRLEQVFDWPAGSIRKAAELAILLHDVGKLRAKWQGWARRYQTLISGDYDPSQAYAHTDRQAGEHYRHAEKEAGRRPWHAVESAIACVPILANLFGEVHPLVDATFSAIARHHTPYSANNQTFRLIEDAERYVRETLKTLELDVGLLGVEEAIPDSFGAQDLIANPDNPDSYLAYLLLVRVLRRADTLGTARGTKGV